MTPNLTKIHSLPALKKPTSDLVKRRGRYWMIYYNEDRKTRLLDLGVDSLTKALDLQKSVYQKCGALGCGPKTKMQLTAEEVLRKPLCNTGIVHSVHFGGVKSPTFSTVVQARNFRNKVAQAIVKGKSNSSPRPVICQIQ